jgi:NAD(P)-dependent dehydrogenase (short-subunit alcohol dehydrogenase family)
MGEPFMAHDGGARAYVQSLGLALHEQFKPRGVYVTVLPPGLTDTPVLDKFARSQDHADQADEGRSGSHRRPECARRQLGNHHSRPDESHHACDPSRHRDSVQDDEDDGEDASGCEPKVPARETVTLPTEGCRWS